MCTALSQPCCTKREQQLRRQAEEMKSRGVHAPGASRQCALWHDGAVWDGAENGTRRAQWQCSGTTAGRADVWTPVPASVKNRRKNGCPSARLLENRHPSCSSIEEKRAGSQHRSVVSNQRLTPGQFVGVGRWPTSRGRGLIPSVSVGARAPAHQLGSASVWCAAA